MSYRFDTYQAADGWRWRLVAGNGETVADSGEAYDSKSNARRAVKALVDNLLDDDTSLPDAS